MLSAATRWVVVLLAGALVLSAVLPAGAQDSTATVELRVWQRIESPLRIYVSARHEAGSWATLGTIPLSLDRENSRGTFRYGDISLEVPLASGNLTTNVELRVWQRIEDPLRIYVSARHEAGSWATLGTISLPLDRENSRATFRFGDISLEVPLPSGEPSQRLAETQNLRWLRHTHGDLHRQLMTLTWVSDGVTATETEAVDNLLYIGVEDIDSLRSALGLGWVQNGITEAESGVLENLSYIGVIDDENLTGNLRSTLGLGWVRDGVTRVEADAIEWLYWLSDASARDAASVIAMPWFQDGVTETEATAVRSVSWLDDEDDASGTAIVESVVVLPWFQNNITEVEGEALSWLAYLDYWSEETVVAVIGMPFLSSIEGDDVLALRSLHRLAYSRDGRLDAVLTHPNVRDGITDDETTLIAATGAIRGASEVRRILGRGNARTEVVFEKTRHTPNLKISIIRTGTQPRQSTIDDIKASVEFVEGVMNRSLPVSHIIVVVDDYAVTEGYGGTNYGFAFSVLSDDEQHERPYDAFNFRSKIIHETAHFFWRGHASWIDEGVANIFEYLYGVDAGVSPGLWEIPRRGTCEAHDLEMLTEWDSSSGQQGRYGCNYFLGQMLFQELLDTMGREALTQGLRNLYGLGRTTEESGETAGIAEVREAFGGQASLVEKHWSGALNAPENRPFDESPAWSLGLIQWDQYPTHDGEFVTFSGTLLDGAVLSGETIADARAGGSQNFTLSSADGYDYVGRIYPPLGFVQGLFGQWQLDEPGDVVASDYDLVEGIFTVRFPFPEALGDPSDYAIQVWGFPDAGRTPFTGDKIDLLGYARIRAE